jgi:hypothetical protein
MKNTFYSPEQKQHKEKISIKNNELQMHISAQSTTMVTLLIELMQSIAKDCV